MENSLDKKVTFVSILVNLQLNNEELGMPRINS